MSHRVWSKQYEEGFCALGALEEVPDDEEILAGRSRAAGFPTGAYYQMRDDYPDTRVPDNLYTTIHHVISDRLRQLLVPELGASRVEMLPVKIKDHGGGWVEGEYFILNPLDSVDCVDLEASQAKLNDGEPPQIKRVKKLVLKPLSGEPALFRPASWTRLILVRSDIADKLEAAGLSGMSFWECDEFRG
jgi:hypothetical protein